MEHECSEKTVSPVTTISPATLSRLLNDNQLTNVIIVQTTTLSKLYESNEEVKNAIVKFLEKNKQNLKIYY